MKLFSTKGLWLALAIIGGASTMANAQDEYAVMPISEPVAQATPSLNIRVVDSDVILSKFVKAVEYKEWATAKSDSIKTVLEKKYKAAQDFEAKCQKKVKNNQYKTQQAYEADVKKFQSMVESAQKLEEKLTKEYQTENAQRSGLVQDEIVAFINEYNLTRKYDAIIYKSAGILFNPALDITNDIVSGLNARYAKTIEIQAPDQGLEPQKLEDKTIVP